MKFAQRGGIGGRMLALAAWVLTACGAMAETPDKFVRYVEATGQQAVDVGVRGRYGTKIEAKLAWTRINTDSSFLDARGDAATVLHALRQQRHDFAWIRRIWLDCNLVGREAILLSLGSQPKVQCHGKLRRGARCVPAGGRGDRV